MKVYQQHILTQQRIMYLSVRCLPAVTIGSWQQDNQRKASDSAWRGPGPVLCSGPDSCLIYVYQTQIIFDLFILYLIWCIPLKNTYILQGRKLWRNVFYFAFILYLGKIKSHLCQETSFTKETWPRVLCRWMRTQKRLNKNRVFIPVFDKR
jgi:hypothetical protein